jgi:hypothetical protein
MLRRTAKFHVGVAWRLLVSRAGSSLSYLIGLRAPLTTALQVIEPIG